jgi:tRNA A37 threonylcarbamoyladenosine synthetase subunit TsaC/SUA5/YrdC
MRQLVRHEVHPVNPQARLLQDIANRLRAGAIAALPTAAGHGLACRLDDKAAATQLRRCTDPDERAPAALLCRDLAQAAAYLQVDDRSFRVLRDAGDGEQAFVLRCTRRVPRRLAAATGGLALLHFAGQVAAQQLLELLDEPLLLALPTPAAVTLDALPPAWWQVVDVALDAGPQPQARPARLVDLDGRLQTRPSLCRWAGAEPALA